MQAITRDIIKLIDKEASFDLAEDWDNSGLQAGNMSWHVNKILIALDPTIEVMEEAAKINADFVLTHHPLFIKSPECIDFSCMPGSAISVSAKNKISIVSAHTNLDKAHNGLNDYFANIIGLKKILPLMNKGIDTDYCSIGRKGKFEKTISLKSLALKIKDKLKLSYIRVIGDENLEISSAVVVTGSGGSMIEDFFQSKTDVFITGDVKYHEARVIEEKKLGMIDVGHFGSEYIAIQLLAEKLTIASRNKDYGFEIFKYEKESDPFNIV
ncbi:MAG: Nif3-like dinuclear metal center hexameric protein [Desulfobacteraceae bacterium]|nr:Nif3-like dinuclear metal center hexameric protein [Desulfobacteraceae bacterium]